MNGEKERRIKNEEGSNRRDEEKRKRKNTKESKNKEVRRNKVRNGKKYMKKDKRKIENCILYNKASNNINNSKLIAIAQAITSPIDIC